MGLRDRKKQEIRHRIIQTAAALFAAKGLDGTTMEEIAAKSDISIATVYNYFGSKPMLLLAGAGEDTDDMIHVGNQVLAKPGPDVDRAVKRLFAIYFDHFMAWDRDLLGEVVAASFRPEAGELTTELAKLDVRLMEQMAMLLQHFAAAGKLRNGTAPEDAALLLYSVLATHLVIFISLDWFPVDELRIQIDRQIDLAFAGISGNNKKET